MLLLKNCPQDEQLLRFIKFCESKFEFKYPVTLAFLPKVRWHGSGIYKSAYHLIEIDMQAGYTKYNVFVTVAHEIRHAYQHMYNTVEWVDKHTKAHERDAHTWSLAVVEDFGDCRKDVDLAYERYKSKTSWFDNINEAN